MSALILQGTSVRIVVIPPDPVESGVSLKPE
jgi:hypothetical protein